MVKKNMKSIYFLLPLALVVVVWYHTISFIAYADFSPPQSRMQATRRYEEKSMNKGTVERVQFLKSTEKAKPELSTLPDPKNTQTSTDEKKSNLPAWMTVLSAVGLLGASKALSSTPAPLAKPTTEYEIVKIPRTIYANVTNMIDKTVEMVKSVPYTVYETAQRTVDKVIDVTRQVAETVYETVKENVVRPIVETYDKAVTKTKQVTEYVTKQFEETSQVAKTVFDKVERFVDRVVPVVRQVTDYVTTKVEEAYQYATKVTRDVAEWVMEPVKEAYEVVREVPRKVTEYVTEKMKQSKEVARTVYDNVERSKVWFEEKASTVWDEVKETKTRLVEKFEDARRWVGDTYRTVTERVWGKTGDSVRYENVPIYQTVAETSTSWIKKGWNWLKNTTTKWVTKVVGWTKRKIIEPIYGWVSRSYQQLVEAGHWVTDKVKRFVNETYTEIKRIPRTIFEKVRHVKEWVEKIPRTVYDTVTEWVGKVVPVVKTVYDKVKETAYRMVEKPVQKIKQVAETVWNTATRVVDKVIPVIRQVTDYVTEKVKEVVDVPRTIYENVVNIVEKVVPVVKEVAETVYEKAERIVDKIVEVSKDVAKTVYRQVTEKVITPVVEAYEVAVEKFKDVVEYVTSKVEVTEQVARTVYDEVKVPAKGLIIAGVAIANPSIGLMMMSEETKKDIAIGTGKWVLGIIELATNPKTYLDLSSLGESGIKLLGRVLTPKSLEQTFGFDKESMTGYEQLKVMFNLENLQGPIDPEWVKASNPTQFATMIGLDVATLFVGLGELNAMLKGAKVVEGVNTVKKSEGILNLIKNVFSKSKTAAPAEDITKAITNVGKYNNLLPIDEIGKIFNLQKTFDGKLRYFVNGKRLTPPKEVDFILKNGKLKFGKGHSFITKGDNVDYAGRIKIGNDGKSVEFWDNWSGHYQPKPNDITGQQAVREAFRKQFDLELPEFTPHNFAQ